MGSNAEHLVRVDRHAMRDEHDAVDAQGSRIGTTVELGGTYIGLDAQCYLGITGRAQSISADRELVILSHQQIVYLIGRGDKALSQFLLLHSTIFLGIGNDGVHFEIDELEGTLTLFGDVLDFAEYAEDWDEGVE